MNFKKMTFLYTFLLLAISNFALAVPEKSSLKTFPQDFLWGVGTSEFQGSGSSRLPHSNWAVFEEKTTSSGKPFIANGEKSGFSVDQWGRYNEDIALMKELGVNSFRFSIDWSAIEPQEGVINQEAINHYHELLDALNKANIIPMVTLHHFTHPQWFDGKGAFTKEENISYFVNFCIKMVVEYSSKVTLWCTINEPAIHAFSGYLIGIHSPGENAWSVGVSTTAEVLKNMLIAHTRIYDAIKALPGGDKAQIGIVHNYLKFTPRFSWEPLEASLASFFTYITNDLTMDFLKTGIFDFNLQGFCSVKYYDLDAPKKYDFFGLNYYAAAVVGFNSNNFFGDTCFPDQVMGDMNLPIDPKGFAEALDSVALLGKPIYITENGVADNLDDRRPKMLADYLTVLKQAMVKKMDIRGYFHWTLSDNFEWHEGTTKKFGLCTADRSIKASGLLYKQFIQEQIA